MASKNTNCYWPLSQSPRAHYTHRVHNEGRPGLQELDAEMGAPRGRNLAQPLRHLSVSSSEHVVRMRQD